MKAAGALIGLPRETPKCRFRPRRHSTANVSSAARAFGPRTRARPHVCGLQRSARRSHPISKAALNNKTLNLWIWQGSGANSRMMSALSMTSDKDSPMRGKKEKVMVAPNDALSAELCWAKA